LAPPRKIEAKLYQRSLKIGLTSCVNFRVQSDGTDFATSVTILLARCDMMPELVLNQTTRRGGPLRLSNFLRLGGEGRARTESRRRAKSGATAVEFAFVAPILLVLMFAVIEAGAVYIGEAWLQFATGDVARQIRTGQVQSQNLSQLEFRDLVCSRLTPFLACDTNLTIDVEAFGNNFAAANFRPPVDANGHLNTGLSNYNPGAACDVVLVRTFYTWTIQTPFFTPFLVNMANNQRMLSAAAAFRNEPFTSGVTGCT
jgi:Flp pilus assembly protein TadG